MRQKYSPDIAIAEELLDKAEPRYRTASIVLYADPSSPTGQMHAVKTNRGSN